MRLSRGQQGTISGIEKSLETILNLTEQLPGGRDVVHLRASLANSLEWARAINGRTKDAG